MDGRNYVKRRETFHYGLQPVQTTPTIEIKPEPRSRRGSVDAAFYYENVEKAPQSTKIYIEGAEERKLKSKSLDRIRDGLDTMVDIVVTDQTAPNKDLPLSKPTKKTDNLRHADRTVFLPVSKEPSAASQTFLLKRGYINAGLYSGVNPTTGDYYNKTLAGGNLSVSVGKLADLPSGLY